MKCADCNIPCEHSNPLGYCYKEKKELPHGPHEKGYLLRSLSDEALIKELEVRQHPLLSAACDLVDAVERYVTPKKGQFCHRTELLNKVRKLKELL